MTRLEPAGLLLARGLLAALFLHEGWAKILGFEGAARYAEAFGVPAALLPLAIAVELGGGALILTGALTRPAALALAGFCLFTAAVFHTKAGDHNQMLHFEKNLGLAGGFLALACRGAGPWSLDHAWRLWRSGRMPASV